MNGHDITHRAEISAITCSLTLSFSGISSSTFPMKESRQADGNASPSKERVVCQYLLSHSNCILINSKAQSK